MCKEITQNINTHFETKREKEGEGGGGGGGNRFFCPQSISTRRNIKNLDNDNMAFCSEPTHSFVNFLIRELLLSTFFLPTCEHREWI